METSLEMTLKQNGYENLTEIDGLGACGVMRFIYTVGVCWGMDETGYSGRFCFDSALYAKLFLKNWDGKTYPVVGLDGCTAIKGTLPGDIE